MVFVKISEWINIATQQLYNVKIESAHLDSELILARVLSKPREWLIAHSDFELGQEDLQRAENDISRRLNREPLAYILGEKEFYGRKFFVDQNVLVPRPESEQIIEKITQILQNHFRETTPPLQILDIGTGSGALAITAALEFPCVQVTASDISDTALKIAEQNAAGLGAKITFLESDLLDNIDEKFDIIIANLPYIDEKWQIEEASPETGFEPQIALFAGDDGLELIKKLIHKAPKNLKQSGFLILEMDPRQIEAAKRFSEINSFQIFDEWRFGLVLKQKKVPDIAQSLTRNAS